MGCSKSSSKREVNSNTILPQETRKILNRQPNFTPKTTGKRRTKTPKISRRKEIIKIGAEINGKEMKGTIISVSSAPQLCPTLCDPMNCSTPGLPVHHQLLEFTQTHVHRVGDAIQPSHPFNFMAAVTICSDFGAQKIKSDTVSTVSPSICHEVMGPDAVILVF